jgi:predicted Zn-dependent protease
MLHAMPPAALVPVEEMVARLERALAGSPADATELVWIEARRNQEGNGPPQRDGGESQERTVLVRVRESGRSGLHRTGLTALADVEKAVRQALAQARLGRPEPPVRFPEGAGDPLPQVPGSYDAEIPHLTPARIKEVLQRSAQRGETARLGWAEGRFAVVNSRGLRRTAEVTAAWMEVRCGRAPGAGHAAAVARSLAGLGGPAVFERARQTHAGPAGEPAASVPASELPKDPVPVVLAPAAAAALLDLLNRHALSSLSFLDGTSFLCGRTGEAAFHPAVSLSDEPLAPDGAPFPFDLLGSAKRPLGLVANGVFLGAPRDERLAAALELPPTAHLVAPDEALCSHLSLHPGEASSEELRRRADGGVWVSELDPVEAFDLRALRFRAVARGVRRLGGGPAGSGALGPALPDFVWEDSLPALLARVLGVGNEAVPVLPAPGGDPLLGAFRVPMLAFDGVSGLRPETIPRS